MSLAVLAVAGDLLEDIVVWGVTRQLSVGTDNPGRIFRSRGGSAANVAATAAQFAATRSPASSRLAVRFIGQVGDDSIGTMLCESLSADGVDVRVQRGGATGTVVVLVDDAGERTMIPDRGAAADLQSIDVRVLDDVAWLHLPLYGFETGGSASALVELSAKARERGIPVSIDLSSVSLLRSLGDDVMSLISRLQPRVIFANADEAAHADIRSADLSSTCVVVIKNGADPVEIQDGGRLTRVSVPPVGAIHDSTGAGDSFAAGFLVARVGGASLAECALEGSLAAAEVLSKPGA